MNQNTDRFGGALITAVEEVADSAASSMSIADACTFESFLDGWIGTLSDHARHLRAKGEALLAPIVVVFVGDAGAFSRKHPDWKRRAMLGTSYRDEFAGVLAVGTASIGGFVFPKLLSKTEEFETVLGDAELLDAPAIALMSETKLLIWPEGLNGAGRPFEREFDDDPAGIDLDRIDRELARFYEDFARQSIKWWKNASLLMTVERPEAAVQYDLWICLTVALRDVARVRQEDISGNGRTDITVLPTGGCPPNQSAVLELKTLRNVRTRKNDSLTAIKIPDRTNIRWALKGLQQAVAYRDKEKFDGAFLCLYDFCAGNSSAVEEAIAPHALKYGVLARRYWITVSHEEHREERYPLK